MMMMIHFCMKHQCLYKARTRQSAQELQLLSIRASQLSQGDPFFNQPGLSLQVTQHRLPTPSTFKINYKGIFELNKNAMEFITLE